MDYKPRTALDEAVSAIEHSFFQSLPDAETFGESAQLLTLGFRLVQNGRVWHWRCRYRVYDISKGSVSHQTIPERIATAIQALVGMTPDPVPKYFDFFAEEATPAPKLKLLHGGAVVGAKRAAPRLTLVR